MRMPQTRLIVGRLFLYPLTVLSIVCVIALILACTFARDEPKELACDLFMVLNYCLWTAWSLVESLTITYNESTLHQVRFWWRSLIVLITLHIVVLAPWLVVVEPWHHCAKTPACEISIGGLCSDEETATYYGIQGCDTNWVLFLANCIGLLLELVAAIVVGLTRVLPAAAYKNEETWKTSVWANFTITPLRAARHLWRNRSPKAAEAASQKRKAARKAERKAQKEAMRAGATVEMREASVALETESVDKKEVEEGETAPVTISVELKTPSVASVEKMGRDGSEEA